MDLLATLLLDIRLQARHKLYQIGVVVAVLSGVGIRFFISEPLVGPTLTVYYLVAVGGSTYMFGASMVLFEKTERTLEALRVTPLDARTYIVSKALTLSCFSVLEALIVLALALSDEELTLLPLIGGVFVLGLVYTLIGMGQVASHDSVTSFLFPGALLVSLVLQLPLLYVLGVEPAAPFYLIPTQAPLLLMLAAFESLDGWHWVYALATSAGAVAGAWLYTRRRFRQHLVSAGARCWAA